VGPPCRRRQMRGRDMVDAIVGRVGNVAADVGDAGEVHDGVDAAQRGTQIGFFRQVGQGRDFGLRIERWLWPPPHGGANVVMARELGDQRAADEAGRAGDENACHALLRPKSISSATMAAAPSASAAILTGCVGTRMVAAASATSTPLTAKTRSTTCGTVSPLSSAR